MLRRRSFLQLGAAAVGALVLLRGRPVPTLTVNPNPAPANSVVAVLGAGFANAKTRLLLDGAGATTNIFRPKKDGSFAVGITVSPVAKTQTLIAQQLSGTTWSTKASTNIVVQTSGPGLTVPTVPLSLVGAAGDTLVNLAWQPPATNGGSGVVGYRVYRDGVLAASPTGSGATITGLTNGTAYAFTVSAVNGVGEGPKTAAVSVTPVASSSTHAPGRSFAAPVITSTHTVPSTIDATGATDVTAALNQWIAAQPNGSKLIFPSGSRYKFGTQGLQLADKNDMELVGEGCILDSAGGLAQLNSNIIFGHLYGGGWGHPCNRVQVHGFTLIAHDPLPGQFEDYKQAQQALEVQEGSTCINVWGIEAVNIGGDLMRTGHCTDVWMHNSHANAVGRQGLSVISGNWISMTDCTVDKWGYYCLDVEPNQNTESALDVYFRFNSFGTRGTTDGGFIACGSGLAFQEIGRVYATDNVTTVNAGGSLNSFYNENVHARLHDIEFSRNHLSRAGSTAQFKDTDNLTVIGNTAAGSALTLDIQNCTNVKTS
jgi:hypothetical protein